MIKLASHKRGDTFAFNSAFKDSLGEVLPGIASKLKCHIRNEFGVLIDIVDITETAVPGEYLFQVPASKTKLWPLDSMFLDIEYNDNGIVTSSDTITFRVTKDITYEEVI